MYGHEIEVRAKKTMSFSLQMFKTLIKPKNVSKGNWKDIPPLELLALLKQEVQELEAELTSPVQNNERIADECTDVANFSLFICDVYKNLDN
jgi:hypothetical protein